MFEFIAELWSQLQGQLSLNALLKDNQFFQAGFIGAIIGGVLAFARKVPFLISKAFKRLFVVDVEIRDYEVFEWVSLYLASTDMMKRTRIVSAHREWSTVEENGDLVVNEKVRFAVGIGAHWFWKNSRPWFLIRERETPKADDEGLPYEKEKFILRTFGRSTKHADKLLNDAAKYASSKKKNKDYQRVYVLGQYDWSKIPNKAPRPLASVVLEGTTAEDIITDAREFLKNKKWYRDLSIPYRRGYLLHGAPGSGKSSVSEAIAHELGLDLYVIQFNPQIRDNDLSSAFHELPPQCVVLMEDIDSIFKGRKPKNDKTSLTFTGLLNVIDGATAVEGRILIMTTNHREHLDEALIRPGRIDREFFIDLASPDQALKLFDRFFPESSARSMFSKEYNKLKQWKSPAELQILFQLHEPDEVHKFL